MTHASEVKRESIPFGEGMFGVAALIFSSTAFVRVLLGQNEYGALGDEILASPVKRIVWPLIYLTAAYFLAKRRNLAFSAVKKLPFFLLLLGYIAASIFWSESPLISALSVAALLGNSLTGLYFGVRYDSAEFLLLLGWVYGIIAVATLSSPIFVRDYFIEGGYWIGFFAQKNAMGMNMALGFLVFVMLAREKNEWSWLCRGFAALCGLLVFLSGSATSIVIVVTLVCVMFLQALMEKYTHSTSSRVLWVCAIVIGLVMFVGSYSDALFAALGKSEDLTGRTGLWGMLALMAREKPWFGYGYGGFWVWGGPAQAVWDVIGDPEEASYAHNGYLQLLLDGGMVGLIFLAGVLIAAFRKAWAYATSTQGNWPIYFLGFLLLHNLTEASFVVRNEICWLIFVAVVTQLVRAPAAGKNREPETVAAYIGSTEISPAGA